MIHFIEEINMRLWILVMVLSFTPWLVQAELPLGEVPPLIELSGDKGGRINGESWSSSELQGKVFALFYADPMRRTSTMMPAKRSKPRILTSRNMDPSR